MKSRQIINLKPHWILIITFFIAGGFLSWLGTYIWLNSANINIIKIQSTQNYNYINPLLAINVQGNPLLNNQTLELEFKSIIQQAENKESITNASIYYRDLNSSAWSSFNDIAKFSPGKLLKVPIMMAYYKIAETDPSILEKKITYSGQKTIPDVDIIATNIQKKLNPGEYTVDELIQSMIVDYNNDAANLLFDNIDKKQLDEVFSDLGIDFKEDKITKDFIPLKLYSLFLRVLYNATYLNREYSEKAMTLMIEAPDGPLVFAELPKDIPSANRFGGTFIDNKPFKVQAYDCGVAYYPNHPYLLFAMAEGSHLNSVESFLKEVGNKVYEETKY